MATVGQALAAPEAGWRRVDNHFCTKFIGGTPANYTAATGYRQEWSGSTIIAKFKFKGTQLRLISQGSGVTYSTSVSIKIDGVSENFSSVPVGASTATLLYEKTGLADQIHTVEIQSNNANYVTLDSVDINSTGRVYHPDEVTEIKDLAVGKRIRCNYKAAAGAVGGFSGLGSETKDFIPAASSATPNGDFYFIAVEEWNGEIRTFSDRNIQHSISHDVLNTSAIASGSGLPYKFSSVNIANDTSKAIASSSYSGRDASKAFDGKNTDYTIDAWESVDATMPEWVGYDFGAGNGRAVNKYSITAPPTVGSNAPKSWIFQGSNDLVNWVDLHSMTNQPDFANLEKKVFSFSNTVTYRAYRVYITLVGGTGYAIVGEIEMMEDNSLDVGTDYGLRLPTGGISSTDKDNEWDRHIVNSTLNDTISAGDNLVWNWSGLYSWTSTTGSTSANRINRGSTVNGFNGASGTPTGNTGTTIGFRPVLLVKILFVPANLFLVQDGSNIKSYVNGSWVNVGTTPATEAMFHASGMTNLTILTDAAVQALVSTTPSILYWTNVTAVSKRLDITYVPKPALVLASDDIEFVYTENVDSFTLTAELVGGGILKVIASVDSGDSWITYDGSAWQPIDETDLADVKARGITPSVFNAIPAAQWSALILPGEVLAGKIRFGYYLELAASTDKSSTDTLTSQADLTGTWVAAIHGTAYDYEYPTNDVLRVLIYADGTYKINY